MVDNSNFIRNKAYIIKKLMRQKKVTAKMLSEELDITYVWFSNKLNTFSFTQKELFTINKYLELPPAEFYELFINYSVESDVTKYKKS